MARDNGRRWPFKRGQRTFCGQICRPRHRVANGLRSGFYGDGNLHVPVVGPGFFCILGENGAQAELAAHGLPGRTRGPNRNSRFASAA